MKHFNLLADRRKANALTPEELGELLDRSPDTVVRHEEGRGAPTLKTALRLEFLFGLSISDLLPGLFAIDAHEAVKHVQRLSVEIEGRSDTLAVRKREGWLSLSGI